MRLIVTDFPSKFINDAELPDLLGKSTRPVLSCGVVELQEFRDALQAVINEIDEKWPNLVR